MSAKRITDHFANLVDHDLLIEIKVKVETLTQNVNRHNEEQAKQIQSKAEQTDVSDHETRIRFLERYVWAAIGIIGILNFIGFGGIIWFIRNLPSN